MSNQQNRDLEFLDAKADRWMAEAGVQEMIRAATEVFAKWANPELMERFREQVRVTVRQAYVEGAYGGWADVRARRAAISEATQKDDTK